MCQFISAHNLVASSKARVRAKTEWGDELLWRYSFSKAEHTIIDNVPPPTLKAVLAIKVQCMLVDSSPAYPNLLLIETPTHYILIIAHKYLSPAIKELKLKPAESNRFTTDFTKLIFVPYLYPYGIVGEENLKSITNILLS